MNYLTVEDLYGIMREQDVLDLTDDYRTGSVDTDVLNAAEKAAVSDLELYAARYYELPLPVVASTKALLVQLAKYHLYARTGAVPEDVMISYKATMRKLEQLTPSSLGIPGVEPEAGVSSGISVSSQNQRFNNNFMGVQY